MSWELLLTRLMGASLELLALAILMLLAIRFLPLRSARVRSLLWILVLLKPVLSLTTGTLVPITHLSFASFPTKQRMIVAIEEEEKTFPGLVQPLHQLDRRKETTSPQPSISLFAILGSLWFFGLAILLKKSIDRTLLLQRILTMSHPVPKEVGKFYRSLCLELGLKKRPPIRTTDALNSPALARVLRPVILVPSWMIQEKEGLKSQLAWALRHELRHFQNHDPLASALRQISQTLFFFHPLVWWTGNRWEEEAELACDRALVSSPEEARSYASELYNILVQVRRHRSTKPMVGLSATRTQIGHRIKTLLETGVSGRQDFGAAHISAVSFVALCVLTLGLGSFTRASDSGRNLKIEEEEVVEYEINSPGSADQEAQTQLSLELETSDRSIRLTATGRFSVRPDSKELIELTPGDTLHIEDRRGTTVRKISVQCKDPGELDFRYESGGMVHPMTSATHAWLDEVLDLYRKDLTREHTSSI